MVCYVVLQMPSSAFPLRIAVMADPGQTYNTTTTLQHMIQSQPDIAFLVGDFVYADRWLPYGDFITQEIAQELKAPFTCKGSRLTVPGSKQTAAGCPDPTCSMAAVPAAVLAMLRSVVHLHALLQHKSAQMCTC
jgi:hypothetical protein